MPDDKGFLGKPVDKGTGLTHVSAREYDPSVAQFISIDPILSLDQHQSLNGYAYANNSPVTYSDPTGLEFCADDYCKAPKGEQRRHGARCQCSISGRVRRLAVRRRLPERGPGVRRL
nr:RHS repeat-associated core domain-containing protein [Streptomyces typhae]